MAKNRLCVKEFFQLVLMAFFTVSTLSAIPHKKHEIKISNRTNAIWIWVQLNDQEPIRIWRSSKIELPIDLPGDLTIKIYRKDPKRSKEPTHTCIIHLDNFWLEDTRHSIQIHESDILYRFVGRDGFTQKKMRQRIKF